MCILCYDDLFVCLFVSCSRNIGHVDLNIETAQADMRHLLNTSKYLQSLVSHSSQKLYVTQSGGMSHLSAIFNFDVSYKSLVHFKCCILIQTPSQSDIWLQRYEQFFNSLNSKTMWNIRIYHLFKPVTQNQYSRHPTHSPWSCHIIVTSMVGLVVHSKGKQQNFIHVQSVGQTKHSIWTN